jgi:hypothetical protein
MWSVAKAAFIQIPTEKKESRKALVDLYLAESAIAFLLEESFSIEHFFRIDSELWWNTFTAEQTCALIDVQRTKLLRGTSQGAVQCWNEWKALEGIGRLPVSKDGG